MVPNVEYGTDESIVRVLMGIECTHAAAFNQCILGQAQYTKLEECMMH